ncbi:glycosyltransferase family 2 protein [Phaeobacter gallaeciensis]|uniref:glycosyltransferase family 2 protein n=1 Tax=Phaeobacter gallaeciensis TaxID=60890 RepID=UPI00237F2EBF|nr:glycosyltransferase family 2 protein [Phaeobacter gallaeciensis]MDE4276726.1 glycosyltransferase family 2 protein [Phaeobacter gallaeciensis]MDE4301973.1 glycosyltransferase family 2 protein [Phaeobacter gallaeciensis]MDE4302967.1 glycosyltransferase family 2 protein [Phaeobacter gallaeciensis]MDE4307359.1 glycosyltransferase family 2 protein [Phaeobacter gallaeciensis]MDE4315364.1 glycosyltransferase family 2 protein [Phaeobacter gallaeciensis]
MHLSVVVPCYNENAAIPLLVERLLAVVAPWQDSAEIILVDDGSSDGTWEAIEDAHTLAPIVRGLRLSANRGHQVALTAGLEAARGARIFMLDADLQDPPEILPDMMKIMDQNFDVVYGRREKRDGETLFKRLSAWGFYRFLNAMSDVSIPNDTGDFRLVSRRALDAVLAMPERSRFVRGMFAWAGFRQVAIEYPRAPRIAGETKYPLRAMLRFATDALTGFSTKPLKIATRLSFLSLAVTAFMAAYVFGSLLMFSTAPGWASVVLAISFFSGVQLLTLGILGEYVGRLYMEAKQRPLYFLSQETQPTTQNMDPEGEARVGPAPVRRLA